MKPIPLLGAAVLIAACSAAMSPALSRFPVGDRKCTTLDQDAWERDRCAKLTDFARSTLDDAKPGHASIVGTDLYGPKYMPRISGYGDVAIVHFHLADASEEAFFVRCGAGFNPDMCMLLDPKWPTDTLPTVAP